MGTNYYHRSNICDHCSRYDERHIGKSSYGWRFSLQGYDDVRSWQEWKALIQQGGQVADEYGDVINHDEFIRIVEDKSEAHSRDHIDELLRSDRGYEREHIRRGLESGEDWHDADGFSFSSREFS